MNVIDTELLLITAEGKVDLGEEKLGLKVTPRPKGIDLSLAVPINIGGTLAAPTFTPNLLGTIEKVGRLWGTAVGTAVFTPAAAVGLAGMRGDNPCVKLVQEGLQHPDQPSTPAESDAEDEKGPLESIGGGFRQQFGR